MEEVKSFNQQDADMLTLGHHRYGIVPACYVNNVMLTELLGNGEPAMMNF